MAQIFDLEPDTMATVFAFATGADHDQPAQSYSLIIISTLYCLVGTSLITFPLNEKWYCPN